MEIDFNELLNAVDVVCPGRAASLEEQRLLEQRPGNRRYAAIIQKHHKEYKKLPRGQRGEKSTFLNDVVGELEENGSRFFKFDKKRKLLEIVHRTTLRQKVAHDLWDILPPTPQATCSLPQGPRQSPMSFMTTRTETKPTCEGASFPPPSPPSPFSRPSWENNDHHHLLDEKRLIMSSAEEDWSDTTTTKTEEQAALVAVPCFGNFDRSQEREERNGRYQQQLLSLAQEVSELLSSGDQQPRM